MSENPEEYQVPAVEAATEKTVAKKAAKKAPAKKAAKKAAKKTPAKKAAKKTTAKKAAVKKLAEAAEQVAAAETQLERASVEVVQAELPMEREDKKSDEPTGGLKSAVLEIKPVPPVVLAEPAQVVVPTRSEAAGESPAPRGTGVPPVANSSPVPREPSSGHPDDGPRRFGRVPGGGPVGGPPPAQDGQGNETRSKKRREKRKRKRDKQRQPGDGPQAGPQNGPQASRDEDFSPNQNGQRPQQLSGPKIEADGLLELAPKGFGFLRVATKNFDQARDDVFVPPEILRRYNLRACQWIHGVYQEGPRGPQLVEVTQVNGQTPDEAARSPHFDELKAINPDKRISFETTPDRYTTRVVDIMSPIGRGQRGLIVSPPRSGKTTLLLHMAEAIREKYDEAIHLMVLLVDERPEEVTEFRRALPGVEIYASSNDEQPRNHCRIAELAIERAKRLVESGQHVFLLMDSITRLARAYNNAMARGSGRGRATGSGGVMIGALEVPRRLFAAARNTRGGGSLTIVATALIQTNSRADEAIFMEFKGTGNMELVLDRKIAENYIYPAVDIFKSGTRREELLLPEHMLHKINLIRRGLSGHRPAEAMERLLFFQKKFPNNPQMLLEIKG
ncbi:MAG: transcription termination factor Rho [Luteolibacter sp.]|jgi:transcription termination factor Rho